MKPNWLKDNERHSTWPRCINCIWAGNPYKNYSGGRVLYSCTRYPVVKFTANEYACKDYRRKR